MFSCHEDLIHLRLKKLEGCDISLMRKDLETMTNAPLPFVQKFIHRQFNLTEGSDAQQTYNLLTAYLLYTSLKPSQILDAITRATPAGKRELLREEHRAILLEYFCFLGLWLDMWEAEVGMVRFPKGVTQNHSQFTGVQNRRVLSGRLKEVLRESFAPCKPMMGEASRTSVVVVPPMSTVPMGRSGTLARRSLSASSTGPPGRFGLQRSASWGLSDPGQGLCSSMLTSLATHQEYVASELQRGSTLTEEQQKVVDMDIGRGDLMKVRAYAGTGKTRSLVEYAKKRPGKRFLYIAFNKSAETDAKTKFAVNVDCKTVHALALSVLRYNAPQVNAAKEDRTMPIPSFWGNKELTTLLDLTNGKVIREALVNPADHKQPGRRHKKTTAELSETSSQAAKKPWPTATSVATTVRLALERFWNSTDRAVEEKCLPVRMIEHLGLKVGVVLQWVKGIWMDILLGRAPWLPHDAYLKLLHLRGEESGGDDIAFRNYDIVMFDEAQDANPCMADIVLRQQSKGKTGLIVVGDPYQRIYGFRGAGNEAFDDVKFPPVKTCYLTWSFRFGDSVAGVANILLRALGEPVPVNGARKFDKVFAACPSEQELALDQDPTPPSAPFTVIFRKNITLIEYAIAFALSHPLHKIHLKIQRNFQKDSLFNTLRDAFHLYHSNKLASSYPLRAWKSWADLKAHVEAEAEDGGAADSPVLTLVVQLEPRLAQPEFLQQLARVEANVLEDRHSANADVILVTAHQAKGLEWDRVMVADDFAPEFGHKWKLRHVKYWREEACILYVALTRARKELIVKDPLKQWIAAELGKEKIFLQATGKLHKCTYCTEDEDEDMENDGRKNVLVCTEDVIPIGCFSRNYTFENKKILMCLHCAGVAAVATGLAQTDAAERIPISALTRCFTSGGDMYGLLWCERKAFEEAWGEELKAETERVARWQTDVWAPWRAAREGVVMV
ncbi:P-loop containing nucleoside triphosphate hydrolase protein [Wilcoxina mikolae CBS 423.85]|nr:P-loop containing nucleoside triphosphate hydrolase protein [Wilcoxina mikolae CBS 423.85]